MLPKHTSVNAFGGPVWSAMFTGILKHVISASCAKLAKYSFYQSLPLTKAYIDTMHMPLSGAYKYIVQACCSLSYYPKFCMLRAETARTLGDWIYEDILCQWGSFHKIVTDKGPAFLKVIEYLSKCYHINHIQISGYNSQANGTVEHSHFDIRQSLFKAVDGDQK
jgi:hypothetical protein